MINKMSTEIWYVVADGVVFFEVSPKNDPPKEVKMKNEIVMIFMGDSEEKCVVYSKVNK